MKQLMPLFGGSKRRILTVWIILFLVALIMLTSETGAQQDIQPGYNTPFLTDAELENYNSMNADDVLAFLLNHNSYFQRTVNDVDGQNFDAAEIIYKAAQDYQINPQVILVTLQKENIMVTTSSRPTDPIMKNLMGCLGESNAREQLRCSAERFRSYHDSLTVGNPTPGGWDVRVPKSTQDGVEVIPANKAVAGQFTYTPHAGKGWQGSSPGGVYLFCRLWNDFGFGSRGCDSQPIQPPPELDLKSE